MAPRAFPLAEVSDVQLIAEIERRGWAIARVPKVIIPIGEVAALNELSGEDFRNYVAVTYGVALRGGRISLGVLDMLLKAYPRAARYERIFDHIYGADPDGGPIGFRPIISTSVHDIRRRLRPTPFTIECVVGRGYRLIADPTAVDPATAA